MATLNIARKLNKIKQAKKGQDGFTMTELVVTMVIVSILGAVALPNFLGQVSKAKTTEAVAQAGVALRSAQTYYLEKGDLSSVTCTDLGLPSSGDWTWDCQGSGSEMTIGARGQNDKVNLGVSQCIIDAATGQTTKCTVDSDPSA